MQDMPPINPNLKAWVVFTDQTDLPWLGLLKKGYRHCFVLMHDGVHWMSVDPMANYMEVVVQDVSPDLNLAEWMRGQGYCVVDAPLFHKMNNKVAPLSFLTCVGVCKRVLGIHNGLIFTPWQFYKYLTHKGETLWEA